MNFSKFIKGDSLVISGDSLIMKNIQVDIKGLVTFLQDSTHISKLSLIGLNVDDEGVRNLANLPSLSKLNLSHNVISDKGIIALAKGNFLKKLTSLDLSHNEISDEGAEALAKFSVLTSLDLSYNKITDKGAESLAKLSQLTSLNLSCNEIHGKGVGYLANLKNLNSLELRRNKVDNQGAVTIAKFPRINSIDLSDNPINSKRAIKALFDVGFETITLQDLSGNKVNDHGNERKRKSSLEQETSSSQSPKKLKSDETKRQSSKQLGPQSNQKRKRSFSLQGMLCIDSSSSPVPSNAQQSTSGELSEVSSVLDNSRSAHLDSNGIETVSKSQSR